MSWSDAEFPLLGLPGETLSTANNERRLPPITWTYECKPASGLRAIVEPAAESMGRALFVRVDYGYAGKVIDHCHTIESPLQALAFIHDCVQRMSNPKG